MIADCRVFLFLSCLALLVNGCALIGSGPVDSGGYVVQISDDGRYIVSTDGRNGATALDIADRRALRLSRDANIYSASAGPDGLYWQNLDDEIYKLPYGEWSHEAVELVVEEAPPVYGMRILEDGRILFATADWGLYLRALSGDIDEIRPGTFGEGFPRLGKLFNLTVHPDGKRFLTAGNGNRLEPEIDEYTSEPRHPGFSQVTLWSLSDKKPERIFVGNSSKTHATLSPDGQYVVSGCENTQGLIWDAGSSEMIYRLGSPFHGILKEYGYTDDDKGWVPGVWDDEGLIDPPEGFNRDAILAVKFISDRHFLRFSTYSPWVMLYKVGDPLPMKYFHLGDNPMPAVHHYGRNEAIATAPATGLLVIAENRGPRLIGYQFDEDELTLTREWIAHPRRGFREASPVSQQY